MSTFFGEKEKTATQASVGRDKHKAYVRTHNYYVHVITFEGIYISETLQQKRVITRKTTTRHTGIAWFLLDFRGEKI